MTTVAPPTSVSDQQHMVLHEVSWQFYEHLLDEIGDRPIRVTFDNGSLEMMAPLPLHERWKKYIARMIELLCVELDIEIDTLGSTTFRREDLAKGLEPDECYYLQHAEEIHGKKVLDLTADPPPDLAVEVEITRRSVPRHPVYAALGVPELWTFDGRRLLVRPLGSDRVYHATKSSLAFPFLPMDRFEEFLLRMGDERQATVLRQFRKWVSSLSVR